MKVAIIGVGLIGGSVGKGLIESGLAERVYGLDHTSSTLESAITAEAIHEPLDVLRHGASIDLWVIATPPQSVIQWLEFLQSNLGDDVAVTDTASIKSAICRRIPSSLAQKFVGGHPMLHISYSGFDCSRPDLFAEKQWFLVPGSSSPVALRKVEMMVHALDAVPIQVDADDHDRHAATVNHLPMLLSHSLRSMGKELPYDFVDEATWAEFMRNLATNPKLWSQVLMYNQVPVREAIGRLKVLLDTMDEAMQAGDLEPLERLFRDS